MITTIKRFSYIFLCLLAVSACEILDKEPLAEISPNNFFESADDAESAAIAMYDALQSVYGQPVNVIGEMPGDNVTSTNTDVTYFENITWSAQSGLVSSLFQSCYVAINRANSVLANVAAISMDETRQSEILGEAYFVRALSYFNLVRVFGGVPIRLEPVTSGDAATVNEARATADEVYQQILADLDQAEEMAPASPGDPATARGMATTGAAVALKAKTYLYMRDWANALAEAEKVLNNSLYTLVPNFNNLFPPNNNDEAIFEIQFMGNPDTGFSLPDLILPLPYASYSFPKYNIPATDFIENYADTTNDLRFANNGTSNVSFINMPGEGNDAGYFVFKWRSPGNFFNGTDNYTVMRLADIKLVYAEASNEANGPNDQALQQINDIRQRANLPLLTLADVATQQAMRDEIDRQRRLELAFEGERWYDLVRYANHEMAAGEGLHQVTALDIIEQHRGTRDTNYLLFAIPQTELNNNNLINQNPGF